MKALAILFFIASSLGAQAPSGTQDSAHERAIAQGAPALARRALRSELVGCYALFTGDGKRVDSDWYNASPLARLDSTIRPAFAADPVWRMRLLIRLDTAGGRLDSIPPRHSLGPMWWADSLTDSVRLSFTTGFSGAFLVLAPSPRIDTLHGHIEDHWDFTGPTRVGTKAYAIRVHCIQ